MTALTSQAVLITELTEMRHQLWMLIAVGKQIAHALPARERAELLSAQVEAERALTR